MAEERCAEEPVVLNRVASRRVARVAIGGIWHETNTFAGGTTTLDDFDAYQLASGDELVERFATVRNEIGGFIHGARRCELALVPTTFAAAVPSGTVASTTFGTLRDRIVGDLEPALAGVLLALHGSLVVEDCDDPEAALVGDVRSIVGDDVPIVVTLDFHANVSHDLFEAADALIGYQTYPHVDAWDRGVEATEYLSVLLSGASPGKAFRKLPMLTSPLQQRTSSLPMRAIFEERASIASRPDVLAATVSPGFPYADVRRVGCAVSVYATSQTTADEAADQLTALCWSSRNSFDAGTLEVSAAIELACAADSGPVILVDVADNIGGGSPGDGTIVLAELIRQSAGGAVVTICDPGSVAACVTAGIGAPVELDVGGHADSLHGEPVHLAGVVRSITDGEFVHTGTYMTGQRTSMGTTAVVDVDGAGDIEIVITERRVMPFDAEYLRAQGIEPADRRIIVAKSAIAWEAAFGATATQAFPLATPGVCTSELHTLDYRSIPRPMFPLDRFEP